MTSGSSTVFADIVVYQLHLQTQILEPFIIVECKKIDTPESQFKQSIKQAESYARLLAPHTTQYIWATKGNKNEYFFWDKNTNSFVSQNTIPRKGQTLFLHFAYAKGGTYTDTGGTIHTT